MSYMGPRYVGGGGQIFPQNQQNPQYQPQPVHRQYQVMQMQMQLQQKIQMQKLQRNMEQGKPEPDDKNQPKPGQNQPNPGQNQPNPGQNQPNPGQNQPNPGQNQPNPGQNQPNPNLNRPGQNQPNSNVNRPGQNQPNANVNRPGQNQPNANVNRPGQNQPNSNMNRPGQNQSNSNMNRPNTGPQNTATKPIQNQSNNQTQRNMNSPNQGQQDRSKSQTNSPAQSQTSNKPNNSSPGNQDNRKPITPQNKDIKESPNDKGQNNLNKSRFGNKPQENQSQQPPLMGNKPGSQQGSLLGSKPQGQNSLLGAKPQGPSGSLMAKPPAPPLLNNPQGQNQKPEIKNELNQSPNKNQGRPNQNNYNSNQHDSYNEYRGGQRQDQGQRPNQQNYNNRGSYGKGPSSYNQEGGGSFNRPGRNMSNHNDYQNRSNRSGQQQQQGGPNKSGASSNYKGSKNFYGPDKVKEKVLQMFTSPQIDLPALDISEKKFNAYARLFIGNIPKNCEQTELVGMFEKYGEIGSVYLNKESSFAFINFDFKANAAKAMRELDNAAVKNRYLKVRFATISEGIRVKNLSPYVSNELLEKAFTAFGVVESCRVVVDDRGTSKGEGVIIFRDKKAAILAIKKCQEECYFLSGAMRPVVVVALEPSEDNVEGLPESALPKNDEYHTERQIAPHFADSGSFEFDFGVQWKQLFTMYDEKKSVLDRDFQIEMERLEKKMVLAKVEYEAEKLRKELAQREAESAQLRRHFEFTTSQSMPAGGSGSGNYDSYSGGKRPLEQGYEGGSYDNSYSESYDRSGYNTGEYDRGYDQSYGSYGRDEYRREGGYNNEEHYDRSHYDRPAEVQPERSGFEVQAEPGYAAKAPETPLASEPYKAPNKRPRY